MRQVTCKNCGAVFSDELEKCPYCGTMNKRGAYRKFRMRISGMIDRMLGMREEAYESISRMIFVSVLRSLLMIAVITGLAFAAARHARVNYYNDAEMDEKAYQTIMWEDENLEKLDAAYEKEDYETIRKLYYENSRVVSRWSKYPSYSLKAKYRELSERDYFNVYELQNILYFLYDPEFYAGRDGMKSVDAQEYEEMRNGLLLRMEERGYSEAELAEIYFNHADKYGYISLSDLEEYVKE